MAAAVGAVSDAPLSAACIGADCGLGSIVADAVCAWASDAEPHGAAKPFQACLVPTRVLGGGLARGPLRADDLRALVPPYRLASLTLTASALRAHLNSSLADAWRFAGGRACTRDDIGSASSWQVSGVRFERHCSRDAADVFYARALRGGDASTWRDGRGSSTWTAVDGETPIPVLTLVPALPMLPAPRSPPVHMATDLRQASASPRSCLTAAPAPARPLAIRAPAQSITPILCRRSPITFAPIRRCPPPQPTARAFAPHQRAARRHARPPAESPHRESTHRPWGRWRRLM